MLLDQARLTYVTKIWITVRAYLHPSSINRIESVLKRFLLFAILLAKHLVELYSCSPYNSRKISIYFLSKQEILFIIHSMVHYGTLCRGLIEISEARLREKVANAFFPLRVSMQKNL